VSVAVEVSLGRALSRGLGSQGRRRQELVWRCRGLEQSRKEDAGREQGRIICRRRTAREREGFVWVLVLSCKGARERGRVEREKGERGQDMKERKK
jgi:hypothetical protein